MTNPVGCSVKQPGRNNDIRLRRRHAVDHRWSGQYRQLRARPVRDHDSRHGERCSTSVGTAHVSEYSYDAAGNIKWVEYTAPGSTKYRTSYEYDEANRLSDRTLPTSVTTEWMYDTRDRITSIIHKKSNGTTIASYTYDHPQAGVGEPHRITREDGSYVDLTYDAALRLESEAYRAPRRHFAGDDHLQLRRLRQRRPDAVVGPHLVMSQIERGLATGKDNWLAAEFKLSTKTLITDYVGANGKAAKNPMQLQAIAKYTKKYTQAGRIALFVTLFAGGKSGINYEVNVKLLQAKMAKKGILGIIPPLTGNK